MTMLMLLISILFSWMPTNTVQLQEPYGGCDEAYLYPDTPGFDDCVELGLIEAP